MGGKEWGLSNPQQTAQRAAAGARNLAGEAFLRKEGGRRPTGPTDSHSGEPRVHRLKLIRAAINALTPAALSSFQVCGRERGWRLGAGFWRVESCVGEQI